MPPWTVHDHSDEFIKLAAFLIEMEQWRKQKWWREEKAISTIWKKGKRRLWGRWMCLGVMGCRDNKRKRREDEGSSYRLCNINLWCRDKRQVSTASEGRISFSWAWMQGTVLKKLLFLNQDQTFLDLHLPALPKSLKTGPEAELIIPRNRSHKGPRLFIEVIQCVYSLIITILKTTFPS